jgi:hypothetical protein
MSETVRDLWVAQQNYQVDSDLQIWNKLSYVDHAPWAKSEASPMRMLRAWTKQFYESVTADDDVKAEVAS